jgi:hypothetical protein
MGCHPAEPLNADFPDLLGPSDASIAFTSFERNDGTPFDPETSPASGTIGVGIGISVNRAQPSPRPIKARFWIDGMLVQEEALPVRSETNYQHTFHPVVVTNELDPSTNLPKHANGERKLRAELLNEAGEVIRTIERTVRFENPDEVRSTAAYDVLATATDADGNSWIRGGLTVRVNSALFTPLRVASSADLDLAGTKFSAPHVAGASQIVVDGQRAAPNGIAGQTIRPEDAQVTLNTNQGTLTTPLEVRVDNEGPTIDGASVVLPPTRWAGRRTTVPDLVEDADDIDDQGVGKVGLVVEYTPTGSAGSQTATDLRAIGETSSNSQVTVEVFAVDALGNRTRLPGGGTMGRDSTRAAITIGSAPADSVLTTTASATVQLAVTDTPSGVPVQNPVRVTIERAAPDVSGPSACVVGEYDAAAEHPCRGVPAGTSLVIPAGAGFWKVRAKGVDVAGNFSKPLTRVYLRDGAAPIIANQTAALLPNGDAQFSFVASDDVATARGLVYFRGPFLTASTALNTTDYVSVTDWGTAATNVPVTFSAPPITSFQVTNAAGAIATPPAAILNYIVEAVDHAGNPVLADVPVLGALLAGADARTRGVELVRIASPPPVVCNGDPAAPPCPAGTPKLKQVLIEAQLIEGASPAGAPFQEAYIWVRDPAISRFVLGGKSGPGAPRTEGGKQLHPFEIPVVRQAFRAQDQAVVLGGARATDGGLVITAPWFVRIIDGS